MNKKEDPDRAPEQQRFRAAMGRYPTGVAVVAAFLPDGAVAGLTINSFHSVSLQPLLVSWNLGRRSQWLKAFQSCSHYGISVLASGQVALARQFARHGGPPAGAVAWSGRSACAPVLPGAAAGFICANGARHDAGDHVIFVGEVQEFFHDPVRAPLLFHAGDYYDGDVLRNPLNGGTGSDLRRQGGHRLAQD